MGRKQKIKAFRKAKNVVHKAMTASASRAHNRIDEMTTFDLGVVLTQMGIRTTDQESFKNLIPADYTADAKPIVGQWLIEMGREATLDEIVFLQIAAMKLWMSWCPERPCDMFLEMSYEEGYECWDVGDDDGAIEHWTRFMILLDRRFRSASSAEAALEKMDVLLGEDWEIWFEDYRMLVNDVLPVERVLKIEAKIADLEKPIDDVTVRKIQELERLASLVPLGPKH